MSVPSVIPRPILRLTARRRRPLSSGCPSGWGFLPSTGVLAESSEGVALLEFDYAGIRVTWGEAGEIVPHADGEGGAELPRNRPYEQGLVDRLRDAGLYPAQTSVDDDEAEVEVGGAASALVEFVPEGAAPKTAWFDFILLHAPELEAADWVVEIEPDFPYQVVEHDEEWYAEVEDTPGNDWFGLDLGIGVEGRRVQLLPLLLEVLRNPETRPASLQALGDDHKLMLRMEDGRFLPVAVGRVRNILAILVELQGDSPLNDSGRLRMAGNQAAQLAELDQVLADTRLRWVGGEQWRALGRRLQDFDHIRRVAVPPGFCAELRPYQREGLAWLQFLREYGFGGILADDMGLGKTVQALAHVLLEKRSGRMFLPSLVVAPTTLMVNWRRETERFAPELNILVLHGPDRKQQFARIPFQDVVFTTYPLLPRDREILLEQQFHVLILDEAQVIKNPRAKATQVALQIKAHHRLCLTGTPMENHLGELWSLFHFLMPGLLGDERRFRKLFRVPIEKFADDTRRKMLLRRIRPFMLRRTKQEVVKELPPKIEILRTVDLDGSQRDLYETIRLAMHDKIRQAIKRQGMQRSRMIILDALLKLRQVCCDPRLLKLEAAHKVRHSAKLALLMDMLPEMVEEGRRILLFSQFTSMLRLIEEALANTGIEYVQLTGKTRDRATPISRFQDGGVPLFLISLKAGGTGLNLTAADTVIHFDPWWNPAVEAQATDRAHRIGQDKTVFVYKLIAAETVEEKILELQRKKAQLANGLFGEGGASALDLTGNDLEVLFESLA